MREAIGPGGTGAYTNSQGIGKFRDDIAHFITARDGHVSFPSNIFLTNGASAAIENVLTGLIGNNRDAIMIPIPQYVSWHRSHFECVQSATSILKIVLFD